MFKLTESLFSTSDVCSQMGWGFQKTVFFVGNILECSANVDMLQFVDIFQLSFDAAFSRKRQSIAERLLQQKCNR